MRERLERFVDRGSFVEYFKGPGFIVTGRGTVGGKQVVVVSANPLFRRVGIPDFPHIDKIARAQELAESLRCPIVYFDDGPLPPASAEETTTWAAPPLDPSTFIDRLRAHPRGYYHQIKLSGLVPQIGVVLGELYAPTSFPPALCDVVVMLEKARWCVGNPGMVQAASGEHVDPDALAGSQVHAKKTGLADVVVKSEEDAMNWVRRYLSYVPENCTVASPRIPAVEPAASGKTFQQIVPADHNKPFPMHALVGELIDGGSLLELKGAYAREIITAFGRLDGFPVGILANNSSQRGGILFLESLKKLTRFVSLCDTMNMPLVFLVDTPGFMVGSESEHGGMPGVAARAFATLVDSSVPKLTVVVRKANTAGAFAMCCPSFEVDAFLALPGASISIFGPKMIDKMVAIGGGALHGGTSHHGFATMADQATNPQRLVEKQIVDYVLPFEDVRADLSFRLERFVRQQTTNPFRKKHPVWPM